MFAHVVFIVSIVDIVAIVSIVFIDAIVSKEREARVIRL